MKNSEVMAATLKLTLDKTDNEDINIATAKSKYKVLNEMSKLIIYEIKKEHFMRDRQFAKNHRELTD